MNSHQDSESVPTETALAVSCPGDLCRWAAIVTPFVWWSNGDAVSPDQQLTRTILVFLFCCGFSLPSNLGFLSAPKTSTADSRHQREQ